VPKSTEELRATLEMLLDKGVDERSSRILLDMLKRGDVEASRAPGSMSPIWLARKGSDLDLLIQTNNDTVDLLFELFVERKLAISVEPKPDVRVRFSLFQPFAVN
jgi:hypothetical protein